jgi:RNA polymerase-binding transcription factor DksA
MERRLMSVKQIENGISKQQLAQFKAILENWQTQLRTVAGSTVKERCTIFDDFVPDPADRAVNANLKDLLFLQAHECHRLLLAVETALGPHPGRHVRQMCGL